MVELQDNHSDLVYSWGSCASGCTPLRVAPTFPDYWHPAFPSRHQLCQFQKAAWLILMQPSRLQLWPYRVISVYPVNNTPVTFHFLDGESQCSVLWHGCSVWAVDKRRRHKGLRSLQDSTNLGLNFWLNSTVSAKSARRMRGCIRHAKRSW